MVCMFFSNSHLLDIFIYIIFFIITSRVCQVCSHFKLTQTNEGFSVNETAFVVPIYKQLNWPKHTDVSLTKIHRSVIQRRGILLFLVKSGCHCCIALFHKMTTTQHWYVIVPVFLEYRKYQRRISVCSARLSHQHYMPWLTLQSKTYLYRQSNCRHLKWSQIFCFNRLSNGAQYLCPIHIIP